MQPSESCVMTCTLNQRPVYEVTTTAAFRCFNKPQKVNCSWGPRQNRKRQEEVIAAVCFLLSKLRKKQLVMSFSPSVFSLQKPRLICLRRCFRETTCAGRDLALRISVFIWRGSAVVVKHEPIKSLPAAETL